MKRPTRTIQLSKLLLALNSLGYNATFRRDAWFSVLLESPRERWIGHGRDRGGAILHAIEQMLPSRLSQEAFLRWIDALSHPEPSEAREGGATRDDGAAPVDLADSALSGDEGALALILDEDPSDLSGSGADLASDQPEIPLSGADDPSTQDITEEFQGVATEVEVGPVDGVEEGSAPEEALEPSGPPEADGAEPTRRARLRMTVSEVHAELDELVEEVASSQDELAISATELQRTQVLAWICRARAMQQIHPDVPSVHERVREVAGKLGSLLKRWWPGQVRAMRLECTPVDLSRDIALPRSPGSWQEAAELAEERLQNLSRQAGADVYGWRDARALLPRPLSADSQLGGVCKEVEASLGPLGEVLPDVEAIRSRLRGRPDMMAGLERLAGLLRWLRNDVTDATAWGDAVGRLRWLAEKLGAQGASLQRLLDPTFSPPEETWAKHLGEDPAARQRELARREMLQGSRALEGGGEARLIRWLATAFDLELETETIAALVWEARGQVEALGEDSALGGDRRSRRRLRKLKDALQATDGAAAHKAREALLVEVERVGVAAVQVEEAGPTALELMARRLKPHTKGQRALFISNRAEPDLWQTLSELLGMTIDGDTIEPARIRSRCEALGRGNYDLVLAVTGFIGHHTEYTLRKACRNSRARYVRVYKGRPLSCLRALADVHGVVI